MIRASIVLACASLVAGCVIEISPRPGATTVRRDVVFVEAGAAASAGTGAVTTPSSDAGVADAGADAGALDGGDAS